MRKPLQYVFFFLWMCAIIIGRTLIDMTPQWRSWLQIGLFLLTAGVSVLLRKSIAKTVVQWALLAGLAAACGTALHGLVPAALCVMLSSDVDSGLSQDDPPFFRIARIAELALWGVVVLWMWVRVFLALIRGDMLFYVTDKAAHIGFILCGIAGFFFAGHKIDKLRKVKGKAKKEKQDPAVFRRLVALRWMLALFAATAGAFLFFFGIGSRFVTFSFLAALLLLADKMLNEAGVLFSLSPAPQKETICS